ncbi:hypothetical protein RRG08_010373 [Elysia crispata]|uniref:Uncharacterized protein n=1 Tax=Elysia crispata TaxID=231223 RepID=A0AAE1BC91_9GAST|nr:hypothetical protein RRG08_010373 [Elysia crispata]
MLYKRVPSAPGQHSFQVIESERVLPPLRVPHRETSMGGVEGSRVGGGGGGSGQKHGPPGRAIHIRHSGETDEDILQFLPSKPMCSRALQAPQGDGDQPGRLEFALKLSGRRDPFPDCSLIDPLAPSVADDNGKSEPKALFSTAYHIPQLPMKKTIFKPNPKSFTYSICTNSTVSQCQSVYCLSATAYTKRPLYSILCDGNYGCKEIMGRVGLSQVRLSAFSRMNIKGKLDLSGVSTAAPVGSSSNCRSRARNKAQQATTSPEQRLRHALTSLHKEGGNEACMG